jgi:hypothetical protein
VDGNVKRRLKENHKLPRKKLNRGLMVDKGRKMGLLEVCSRCGVPLGVSGDLDWNPNGTITLRNSPKNRMVFFESDVIDNLFEGIGRLIGMPVEHIVIESRARETKRYIERAIPPQMREAVERMGKGEAGNGVAITPEEKETLLSSIKAVDLSIIDISRIYGYGDQRMSDLWESGGDYPWRIQVIRNPYSLLFISADNLGSVEACEGTSMRVEHREIGENTYEIRVFPGEHPIGLKERLKRKRYELKAGDITYERCPGCGVPQEVSECIWDLEEGTITDPDTGRRIAIFGPLALDSIFQDLEAELGEVIPETVIQAQREYIKSAWGMDHWNRAASTFRHMVAVRGMGNLVAFEGGRSGLSVRIENSCLHLLMIGTTQALVELTYGAESSTAQWELTEDGDLVLDVGVG